MKAVLFQMISVFFAFSLSAGVYADSTSHTVSEMRPADIIVSFLYFIGALLLIYAVLTLVSGWGKKHHDDEENGSGDKKNAETEAKADVTEEQSEGAEFIVPENQEGENGKITAKEAENGGEHE